jgi:uncharacterized membrane protein YqjE
MANREGGANGERSSSLSDTFNAVVTAMSSAVHTRLELFVAELEEERERLKQALLLTLLLFFGLSLGFVLLNIFLVALFWQHGWIFAIGGLAFRELDPLAAVVQHALGKEDDHGLDDGDQKREERRCNERKLDHGRSLLAR